jgi:hypothetical protein
MKLLMNLIQLEVVCTHHGLGMDVSEFGAPYPTYAFAKI